MYKKLLSFFSIFLLSFFLHASDHDHDHENHEKSLVNFKENKGQWKSEVLYRADIPGGKFYLEENGMMFHYVDYSGIPHGPDHKPTNNFGAIKHHAVKATFLNANTITESSTQNSTKEYYNYFKGNDKSKWASKVYGYGTVILNEVYNGVDLKFYNHNLDLKYDFIVKPGANAEQIQIEFEGHDEIKLTDKYLRIKTSLGEIQDSHPYAYQIIEGQKQKVACRFVLKENVLSYEFPNGYDKNSELIIDPTLIFATYSGSLADNFGMTATPGVNGELFSGGTVFETGYPVSTGAYDETFNNALSYGIVDVVITKYSPDGTSIEYATLLGGNEGETVHSLIANENNEVYLFGATASRNFPITAAGYQQAHAGGFYIGFDSNGIRYNGGTDMFIAKLSSDGTALLGSTYMGGSNNDGVNYSTNAGNSSPYTGLLHNYGDELRGEIMLDQNENVYIASCSRSSDFPTLNGFDNTYGGSQDGVLFKLNSDLSNLLWSSYLGGSSYDALYGVKIASDGSIYITGGTMSNNLPATTGAIQTTFGGNVDGLVAHVNATGSNILELSYLGTNQYDQSYFIELDENEDVYLYGQTLGTIPVSSGVYTNPNSTTSLVKLDRNLSTILKSTVVGASNINQELSPTAFLVDVCGNIYLAGWGNSRGGAMNPNPNMPITSDNIGTSNNNADFYLMVLEKDFSSFLYGTYFGGTQSNDHVDGGTSRFDKNGVVYHSSCGSCGAFDDMPTTPGAHSSTNTSRRPSYINPNLIGCNNAVFKLDMQFVPIAEFSSDILEYCQPLEVQFENFSDPSSRFVWDFGDGTKDSTTFEPIKFYPDTGSYTVTLLVQKPNCILVDTTEITVVVHEKFDLLTSGDTAVCYEDNVILNAGTQGFDNDFFWSLDTNFTTRLNPDPKDSTLTLNNITQSDWYYIWAYDEWCETFDSIYVEVYDPVNAETNLSDTIECGTIELNLMNNSQNYSESYWLYSNGDTSHVLNLETSYLNTGSSVIKDSIMLIANNEGCGSDTVQIDIEVLPNLNLEVSNDTSLCDAGFIELTASSIGTSNNYIWANDNQFTDIINSPNDSIINVNVQQTDIFYVLVSNGYCDNIDSVEVSLIPAPIPSTNLLDTSDCGPLQINLSNTSQNYTSAYWVFSDGSISTETNIDSLYSNNSNTPMNDSILLVLSNEGCKADTLKVDIQVNPNVTLQVLGDTMLCGERVFELWASSGNPSNIYTWATDNQFNNPINIGNDSTVLVDIQQSGIYYANVSNGYCTRSDSVIINLFRDIIDLQANQVACKGDSMVITVINRDPTLEVNYEWTPYEYIVDGFGTDQITILTPTSGTFYLEAQTNLGCTFEDSIFIDIIELDTNNISATASDYDVKPGDRVQLFALPDGYSYLWSPDDNMLDGTQQNPLVVINDDSTLFTVEITNGPCVAFAQVLVRSSEFECGPPYIYVPNAFTPNDDGENDKLYVRGNYIETLDFKVFNRWGELVFETQDQNIGWDGTYQGMEVDPAVFVYHITATCPGEETYFEKGNITVIR